MKSRIRVAVTEWHGMLLEQAAWPAPGIEYVEARRRKSVFDRILRSPIKGYFPTIDDANVDIVESVIGPARCRVPWLCSVANYQELLAFSILGLPTPRAVRKRMVEPMFKADRFLAFAFWSEAGYRTMVEYGNVRDESLLAKAKVIYPAVSVQPDRKHRSSPRNLLLFSGDFFRKGGVHVVEAFERLEPRYPGLRLRLCCDPDLDFNTHDIELKREFLRRIANNSNITLGRTSRSVIMNELLPDSLAYLLPTYDETFGFAVLEAMASGVPVIATREFALPELIENDETGFLLHYSDRDKSEIMAGYVVKRIPASIRSRLSDELTNRLQTCLDDSELTDRLGHKAQTVARRQFGVERRSQALSAIYRTAFRSQ